MAVLDLAGSRTFQRRFFALAKRFVAGETIAEALDAVAALNRAGMRATLDFLGEDVTTREEAERTREAYLALSAAIRERGVEANVSVKLTAMGLLIDEEFALANLRVVTDAMRASADPFVRVDMEGSALTDATLRVVERAHAYSPHVGPVLQAYLKRTPDDVERAIAAGRRVRLCKGAYRESPAIAYPRMPQIRAAYLRSAEALLTRGVYPGIATHDERIVAAVCRLARERKIAPDRFEFQLLYGVKPSLQRRLVRDGYRVRV
jgi:proline dehydrogenase